MSKKGIFSKFESHIINTILGVSLTGISVGLLIAVSFYFATNSAMAQNKIKFNTLFKDISILKKSSNKVEITEVKNEVKNIKKEVASIKQEQKEMRKEQREDKKELQDQQRKDHNEVMNLLIELNKKE